MGDTQLASDSAVLPRFGESRRLYLTKNGHSALLSPMCWDRIDFAYLGVIDVNGQPIAWAWHENGRSIDRDDRAFDLVGFPVGVANG